MNRKWSAHSPVFRRFLISYFLVLIIPLIAGYTSYWSSIDAAKASSIENSRKTLNLSKVMLERRLTEVEDFTKQMAVNQDLTGLIVGPKPLDRNNVVGISRMQRNLANYSSTNDYLANAFIYLNNYNVIITPNTIFFHPEHYYELNQVGDLSFEDWENRILGKTHLNEILPLQVYNRNIAGRVQRKTPAITFIQSLPINSFNKPLATIGVVIDEATMGEMLKNIVDQYGGWARITNQNGETVFSDGIDEAGLKRLSQLPADAVGNDSKYVDGKLLIAIRSDLNGWLYTAGIPKHAIMAKANRIQDVIGTLTVTSSVIALLIGLLLAYRNSAPIHRMLSLFREQEASVSWEARKNYDFDFLAGNISHLIASNKLLEAELNDQLPFLRDAFIKQLLVGEFQSIREIDVMSAQTGIAVKSDLGYVGILKVNVYGGLESEDIVRELNVARLFVKQALVEIDPQILFTDWGYDKIAVVFQEDREDAIETLRAAEEALLKLLNKIYSFYRLTVNIGMGSRYVGLRDVPRSFNEARQSLEYAISIGAEGITRYRDTIREVAMYSYPIDAEQRLLNMLKAGDYDEGSRIVKQLFSSNFEERELSFEMTQQFFIELKGTLFKLLEQRFFSDEKLVEELKDSIAHLQPTDGVAKLQPRFMTIIQRICDDVNKKKSDMLSEIIHFVVRYIEEHYGDPDLSVYRIAETIGRSEKYISQLFKEHNGEHLSDYIELFRIDKATGLLLENRLSVDDIAVRVGYNSAHSFRRAFKRVRGVTPTAYKNASESFI